jgi:tetratricopeptide (TPR) repeat protein
VNTTRDVGLTFFLQHIERTIPPPWIGVFADCQTSDPEVLFRSFFAKIEQSPALRWQSLRRAQELGKLLVRIISGAATFASSAAFPIAALAAGLPEVVFTPYASLSSQRFAEVVRSRRWKRRVLFLIDNAQEIKPQSLNLLRTVFSDTYDSVRFVLCLVGDRNRDNVNPVDFQTRLAAMGLGVITTEFSLPSLELVSELASGVGARMSSLEVAEVLRQSEGRITHVLASLLGTPRESSPFGHTEREILRYLRVARQPLQVSDILTLFLRSPRSATPPSGVRSSMSKLVNLGWIKRWDLPIQPELEINAGCAKQIDALISEPATDLLAATEIYKYFSEVQSGASDRHAPSAYGALLYRLAKQVDPLSVGPRALDLVRISLRQADLAAARHYVTAALEERPNMSKTDLIALLSFYVSVQEYDEAQGILDQLGENWWKNHRPFRIVGAIILNRRRRHVESNAEIEALLADATTTQEERALLMSYKVAGLLHEGKPTEAVAEFEQSQANFSEATNRGYALRNCASVYFWEPSRDHRRAAAILATAQELFMADNDRFGWLTTENNRAALMGYSKGTAFSLPIFKEVFDGLSVYGVQHLEEVATNLGICHLLNGGVETAFTHFNKMIDIVPMDFPRVLMECGLAFAETALGDVSRARSRMSDLVRGVAQVNLPEATYRANVNAAAIEAAANDLGDVFRAYVRNARGAEFWPGENHLTNVITAADLGQIQPSTVSKYFTFDFLQYWSQNPMSVVTLPTLSGHAECDNMGEKIIR